MLFFGVKNFVVFVFVVIVVVYVVIFIISSMVEIVSVIAEIFCCFCFVVVDVVNDNDDVYVFVVILFQKPCIKSLVKIGSVTDEM